MATAVGGSIAFSSFPSSSYISRKANTCSTHPTAAGKSVAFRQTIACAAVQESSTPTVAAETKETKEVKTADEAVPAKPKRPAKVPAKPLPELMEEDVIPSLRAVLESQDDISGLELSFGDNRGSYQMPGKLPKTGRPDYKVHGYDILPWSTVDCRQPTQSGGQTFSVVLASPCRRWTACDRGGWKNRTMAQSKSSLGWGHEEIAREF